VAVGDDEADRAAALAGWTMPGVGASVARFTSPQLSMALALCDQANSMACDGMVTVNLTGGWTCSSGCDGPPLARHRVDHVELCCADPTSSITCWCSRCAAPRVG
jgi:hypothetical protein